jgi:hypothetical protein
MNTVLFIIVALTASTPIAAAVIVSIASRREDSQRTLGDPRVGSVQMIARRIVGFHTDSHSPRQAPERIPVWWAESPSQPAAPDRRLRPAGSGSRLMTSAS